MSQRGDSDSFLQVCDAQTGGFVSPADVAQIVSGIGIKAGELINADAGLGEKNGFCALKTTSYVLRHSIIGEHDHTVVDLG